MKIERVRVLEIDDSLKMPQPARTMLRPVISIVRLANSE